MSASEDDVLKLVGMAYDAALDEGKWKTFLEAFASATGGTSAILRSNDELTQSASFAASVGYDPAWQAAYCNHFVKVDTFNNAMKEYPAGKIFISSQHIDQNKLLKGEYYNEYLRPQDKVNAFGLYLQREGSKSLVLAVQRGKRAGVFGEKESAMMKILAPHVSRAVQVHRKVHTVTAEKEQAQGALDQMRMGVILTNRFGTPLYLNRAAELMMTQEVGLGIFHNKLAAHSPSETAQLLKMIFDASLAVNAAAIGADMRITMLNRVDFLHCVVTPISPEMAFLLNASIGADCVAVFLSKSEGLKLSPRRLVTLYKITPAEARLVAKLAALRTVEEAADDLGISMATARTQLKSVFGKTGARSQSELLLLLASGTLAQLNEG
jgi:DNA-binding CsgD family transcriptional regulator/PAS domain-containing protein